MLKKSVSIRTPLGSRAPEDAVHTVYEGILQGMTFFMEYNAVVQNYGIAQSSLKFILYDCQ